MPDIGDVAAKEREGLAPVGAVVVHDLAVGDGRDAQPLAPGGIIADAIGRVGDEKVPRLIMRSRRRSTFDEINAFERLLVDDGTHIAKVFLYITPEEQLERFAKRLNDPLKRWKLSYEDFRNRERWDDYERAANEMLERTSAEHAPWLVVPANSKKYARIAALREVADRLSAGVDLAPRPLDPELERRFQAAAKR